MLIIALIYTHKCQKKSETQNEHEGKRSEKTNFRTKYVCPPQKNDGKQVARIQGGKKTGHFICFYCVAPHVKTLGHNHMVINT